MKTAAAFFAFLGLGALVLEIALVEKFVPLLGNSAAAAAITLTSFLAGIALALLRSRGLPWERTLLRRRCALLVLVLLILIVSLPGIAEGTRGLEGERRLPVVLLVSLAAGYLVGRPLPPAADFLRSRPSLLSPAAWSAVALFAVAGSMATLVAAETFGFTTVMLVSPAAFLAAAILAEDLEPW